MKHRLPLSSEQGVPRTSGAKPHYTWLYTFTELTPVQCLVELTASRSSFMTIRNRSILLPQPPTCQDPNSNWFLVLVRDHCVRAGGPTKEMGSDLPGYQVMDFGDSLYFLSECIYKFPLDMVKAWELHKLRTGHPEFEDRHATLIAQALKKFYERIRESEEEKRKQEKIEREKAKQTVISILNAVKAETRDQMRVCLESIKQNLKADQAEKALNTLFTLVKNVAIKPDEEKFRKININNAKFQENIGYLHAGVKFLELCKFTRRDRVLFLPRDGVEMEVLHTAGNELNKALGK